MDSPLFAETGRKKTSRIRMEALALPFVQFGTTAEQQSKFILLGVGIVIALIVMWAWFAWKKHKAHKEERAQHVNTMLIMMQELMAQRSRIDMFPAGRLKNSVDVMFSGFCSGCDEDVMRLDVALKPGMTEWTHPVVDVFFKKVENGHTVFYSFKADVKEAVVNGPRLYVTLPLPVKLGKEQKRDFFRATPLSSVVPAVALWPVDAEQAWLGEMSGRSLGRPVYGFRPGKLSQVILEDISAGGARLGFEAGHYKSLGKQHKVDDSFILLVVLTETSGEALQQYWLNCRCVHTEQSVGRTEPVVGLQFLAWSCTERLTDTICWEPLGDGGDVPLLNAWLTRYVRDRKAEKRAEKTADTGASV